MQTHVIEIRENEYLIKLNRKHFDLKYLRKVLRTIGLENAESQHHERRENFRMDDELSQHYDHLGDK